VQDLNVAYSGHAALKKVSVEIPKGQITAIMGPSGCGKTTLLKSMNRLLELSDEAKVTGQVMIDGIDIYDPTIDVTEVRKKTGLLAQRPFPLPMSIRDNVAWRHENHGQRRAKKSIGRCSIIWKRRVCGSK
jgi:phosphate transport system ATP-binding protein